MIGRAVGKYRILERIGRGGMGTVYRGVDDSLQRDVAIKVLNADLTEPDALRRFRREAITLAKLHHPAIATVFELCEDEGDLLMIMEYVRGETLQKFAERSGQVPAGDAAGLCVQVLDGLTHAHRAGIVHRDLKPGNIMITDEGLVKVMDFGIARISGSEHLTSDGFTMGTPAYMAPEQLLGHEADARSDLYSVGVLLYRLWTGRLPFQGDTPFAVAHMQVHDLPTPLNVACPALPAWCDAVLARALAKDPADRFQSAVDFKNALLSFSGNVGASDDAATMTMPTPHSGLLTAAAMRTNAATVKTASGATAIHPSAPGGPAGTAPPATDTGSASRTAGTVVLSTRHVAIGVGVLAGLFILLALSGFAVIRRMLPGVPAAAPGHSAAPAAGAAPAASTAPSAGSASSTAAPPAPGSSPPSSSAALSSPRSPAETSAQSPPPAPPGPPPSRQSAAIGAPGPGTSNLKTADGTSARAPAPGRSGASKTANRSDALNPAVASTPSAAASSPKASLAPIAFDKLTMVVAEGGASKEMPVDVQLADGHVAIYGAERRLIASVPFNTVREFTSARSRQPRWRDADGAIIDVKVPSGPLGFMKSDRNWLGLLAGRTVYVLRIDDARMRAFTDAITQRTGAPLVRLPK